MTDLDAIEICDEARDKGVEVGVVGPHDTSKHIEHLRDSLEVAGHKGPYPLYGVFIKGTETIVCYTGNGPNGERNAHAIVDALTRPSPAPVGVSEAGMLAAINARGNFCTHVNGTDTRGTGCDECDEQARAIVAAAVEGSK